MSRLYHAVTAHLKTFLPQSLCYINMPFHGVLPGISYHEHVITDHFGQFTALRSTGCSVDFATPSTWATHSDQTIFDAVVLGLPKGKLQQLAYLHMAWTACAMEGQVILWGYTNEGIGSIQRLLHKRGIPCAKVANCEGGKALQIRRTTPSSPFSEDFAAYSQPLTLEVPFRETLVPYTSLAGTFAHGKSDPGTMLMLTTISSIALREPLLDLACGSGLVSTLLASMGFRAIHMCDVSARAIEAASANARANSLPLPFASDIYSHVQQRYGSILVNPPFHQGVSTDYHVPQSIIAQAPGFLLPGGSLYIVANRFLPYEKLCHQAGAQFHVMHQDNQFKILQLNW
ncbi:methyltransferase [Desulfurispirillum indicum]|uniref:methyltransferase n=1 Tax=Desulfurispirillum indicum TaxID=936456 RepID=UPI001CFBA7D8|nr:methyltransferase [Desulfurispirillum indicum]UCZ55530.1 methyltransferase [Desulfurispirillum indicum]